MFPLANTSLLYFRLKLAPQKKAAFMEWQRELHEAVSLAEGFLSLEIVVENNDEDVWLMTLRFDTVNACAKWQASGCYQALIQRVQTLLAPHTNLQIEGNLLNFGKGFHSKITELFVTEVKPQQEAAFRTWVAKIHQAEAKFPGFCGVYMQAPQSGQKKHWVTFLQFDTQENLDAWLASSERQEMMIEANSLVNSLENHRVVTSYPGWFHVFETFPQEAPPLWKQAMLVLLVLFPIVMLERKYLAPWIAHLNPSVGVFIGNVISVSLLTWPLMPLAIYCMKWWLVPKGAYSSGVTVMGSLLLIALFSLEIFIFS